MAVLIAVAIDPTAPGEQLDLDIDSSGCGLQYVDRTACPQPDLNLKQLAGRVVDATGAVIPGVKIALIGNAGSLVEQLRSDRAGEFASPRKLSGNYELVVASAGFTPFRRTVHAEPAGGGPIGGHALTAQLGVFGMCSTTNNQ